MNTVPTVGFNCERVKGTVGKSKGLTFLIWDVGGQERIRPLWRSYTRCTDGIIFVIDSSEEDNLDEAKLELWRTMKYQDNRDIPLLVLANKQDLQTALTGPDIEAALGSYISNTHIYYCICNLKGLLCVIYSVTSITLMVCYVHGKYNGYR